MKAALRYLPFVGVVFASFALLRYSGLHIRTLQPALPAFAASLVLLCVVLASRGMSWWVLLTRAGVTIGIGEATRAYNLAILTKYVPGKIWPTVSVASLAEPHTGTFGNAIVYTVWYQLLIMASGIAVGGAGIVLATGSGYVIALMLLAALFIAVVLVGRGGMPRFVVEFLDRRFSADISAIGRGATVVFVIGLVQWMAMALAFWLFFYSLDGSVPMSAAFIQPLANVAGILVPFTPAGLGTREAASAAYLHFAIDDLAVAVALATASRFWFLGAEAIVFLSTMIVRSGRKQAT